MPLSALSESLQSLSQFKSDLPSNMLKELSNKLNNDHEQFQSVNFKSLISAYKFYFNQKKQIELVEILENTSEQLAIKIERDLDLVSSIYLCQVVSKVKHKSRTEKNYRVERIIQAIQKKTARDVKDRVIQNNHRQPITIEQYCGILYFQGQLEIISDSTHKLIQNLIV